MTPAALRRILIVEDSDELRTMIVSSLDGYGFEVVQARDGHIAETLLAAPGPLHLIVLDLVLPEVGGYALLARIKRERRHAAVPVVVISGEVDRGEDLGGVAAVLHKPFEISQLQRLVRKFALPA